MTIMNFRKFTVNIVGITDLVLRDGYEFRPLTKHMLKI